MPSRPRGITGPVAHLGSPYLDGADAGLDVALWPETVPHNTLAAVRQALFGKAGHEGVSLRDKRLGKHPARTLAGKLG